MLKASNDEVLSFDELFQTMNGHYPDIDKVGLTQIIGKLKDNRLLYANADLSRMVSVIDTTR